MSAQFNRADMIARYKLFQFFVLSDQRTYWHRSLKIFDTANRQVALFRALFSFLAGLSSALVGLIIQTYFVENGICLISSGTGNVCQTMQSFITILIVFTIVFPPLGVLFSTLADTFQWENQIPLFERSIENIELADALSPDDEMSDEEYWSSLQDYVEGTLAVMSEEAARFEIQTSTPQQLHAFIERQRTIARRVGGDADAPNNQNPLSEFGIQK